MSGVIFFSICYAFKKNKKSTLTFALLGLVITLLVAEAFIIKGRILSTLTSLDFAFLLNGRDDIWLAAWEIFQKSPLVGHGVNSFHDALGAHLALPENADRFHIIRSQYTFWNAHQMILGILCETGLAGLGVFCVIIFKGFKSAIRNFPETLPPFLILTAFLIHGIGGYGFHRSWNAALFFLPLGILEGWKMSNGIEK
jgi:O-antigen ligase